MGHSSFNNVDLEAVGEALGEGDLERAIELIEEGLDGLDLGRFRNAVERARRLRELRS